MAPQTQIASRNGGQLPAGLCTAVRGLQARQNTVHNVSQLFKTINTALEVLPDSAVTWRGVAMLRTGSTPFSFRSEIKNLAHFIASLVRSLSRKREFNKEVFQNAGKVFHGSCA